jgi:hypothetical protein
VRVLPRMRQYSHAHDRRSKARVILTPRPGAEGARGSRPAEGRFRGPPVLGPRGACLTPVGASAARCAHAHRFAHRLEHRDHLRPRLRRRPRRPLALCDYPEWVKRLPALTEPKLPTDGTSYDIAQRIKAILQEGLAVYRIFADKLEAVRPEVNSEPVRGVRRLPVGRGRRRLPNGVVRTMDLQRSRGVVERRRRIR